MPLKLDMTLARSSISSLEALKAEFSLHNGDGRAYDIPGPDDTSAALCVDVYDSAGKLVRRMNGITHQLMLSVGRVNETPSISQLAPGETWTWDIDFALYHYCLPPGKYSLEATYTYEDERVNIKSPRRELEVRAANIAGVSVHRDCPVMDALTLLIKANGDEAAPSVVRLHNCSRPLAGWYSEPLPHLHGSAMAFCSTAAFFQTQEFDPFYCRWLVWEEKDRLHARFLDWGKPDGPEHSTPIPSGRTVIPNAIHAQDNDLSVFLRSSRNKLECYRFTSAGLEKQFEYQLPGADTGLVGIHANEEYVFLAVAHRGLHYAKLDHHGTCVSQSHVFKTRLPAHQCRIDTTDTRIKALFWDGPHGRIIHMVAVDLESGDVTERMTDALLVRHDLRELSFDIDARGRFHLLVSTQDGKLYYAEEDHGPILIASGEEHFFPTVQASAGVYLGCFRKNVGYRFIEYNRWRRSPKVVDYEALR